MRNGKDQTIKVGQFGGGDQSDPVLLEGDFWRAKRIVHEGSDPELTELSHDVTLLFRRSDTFSLKVGPRIPTRAPFTDLSAWMSIFTSFPAMYSPMRLLTRRPARMTSG